MLRAILKFFKSIWTTPAALASNDEEKLHRLWIESRDKALLRDAREHSEGYAAIIGEYYSRTGWLPRRFGMFSEYHRGIVELSFWNEGTATPLWVAWASTGPRTSPNCEISGVKFSALSSEEHEAILSLLRRGDWTPCGEALSDREMERRLKTLPL